MGLQDDVFDVGADIQDNCPPETSIIFDRIIATLWDYESILEEYEHIKKVSKEYEQMLRRLATS